MTLWTVACQAPLFMGFSMQEYWSGLPFPPPGDILHQRSKVRALNMDSLYILKQVILVLLIRYLITLQANCIFFLLDPVASPYKGNNISIFL